MQGLCDDVGHRVLRILVSVREKPHSRHRPLRAVLRRMIAARALISACTLGVFDALADRPDSPEGLAERLELDELGWRRCLRRCARSAGWRSARTDAGAGRSRRAGAGLGPAGIGAGFIGAQNAYHWDTLGRLDEVMRTGRPAGWHEAGPDDPLWEAYIRGLYEAPAPSTTGTPRSSGSRTRGRWWTSPAVTAPSRWPCRRHPDLRATVLDLSASAAVGRRIVAEAGCRPGGLPRGRRPGGRPRGGPGRGLGVQPRSPPLPGGQRASPGPGARRAAPGRLCRGRRDRASSRARRCTRWSSGLLFYAISRARTYTVAEMTAWLEGEVEVHLQLMVTLAGGGRGPQGGCLETDLDWPRDPVDRRHGAHRLHAAAAADGPARARALPGARSAAARRPAGARADRARRPHRSAVVSPSPCGASARSSTSRRRSATSPGPDRGASTA